MSGGYSHRAAVPGVVVQLGVAGEELQRSPPSPSRQVCRRRWPGSPTQMGPRSVVLAGAHGAGLETALPRAEEGARVPPPPGTGTWNLYEHAFYPCAPSTPPAQQRPYPPGSPPSALQGVHEVPLSPPWPLLLGQPAEPAHAAG